jgi:AcrR family transcriptional regulator
MPERDGTLRPPLPPTPRRRPQQQRSRQIVAAIQEASLKILRERGAASLTTNRIAEVAGVNIASVYRYFPNKEAIVAEIYEAQIQIDSEEIEALASRGDNLLQASIEDNLRFIIDRSIDQHQRLLAIDAEFYRQYLRQFDISVRPRSQRPISWRDSLDRWLRIVFERRRSELRVHDTPLAAFLVSRTIHGVLCATVEEHPERLSETRFRDEIVSLTLRYLRDPDA